MLRSPRKDRGRRPRPGNTWYLWIVVAVVVLAGLFMLARTLSIAPPAAVIIPVLASAKPDLETMTRMLGDIDIDPTLAAGMPGDLSDRFRAVDSLIAIHDWPAALELLRRLPRPTTGASKAVIEEYAGYCQYRSASPDRALHSFRQAMAADSSLNAARQFRLAFAAGYLFQSHGYADSALAMYSSVSRFASTDLVAPLRPALVNNLALAHEATGDTARAFELYAEAAALVDTTADTPSARVVRDNLRRLVR